MQANTTAPVHDTRDRHQVETRMPCFLVFSSLAEAHARPYLPPLVPYATLHVLVVVVVVVVVAVVVVVMVLLLLLRARSFQALVFTFVFTFLVHVHPGSASA